MQEKDFDVTGSRSEFIEKKTLSQQYIGAKCAQTTAADEYFAVQQIFTMRQQTIADAGSINRVVASACSERNKFHPNTVNACHRQAINLLCCVLGMHSRLMEISSSERESKANAARREHVERPTIGIRFLSAVYEKCERLQCNLHNVHIQSLGKSVCDVRLLCAVR